MAWPTKKLGEVCEIKKGKKPKLYKQKAVGMLPYLGARFMRGSKEAEYASVTDKNSIIVSEEDLIIICDGSKSGDMFSGFSGILSSTMGKMDFSEKEIEPTYLKLFLNLHFNLFNTSKKGAAIPHLDFNLFKNLEIPLPSLSEQKKIVARLEKLLAKIKEAKCLRAEAQEATQNLLSAELRKIFEEGKKKGWEEKNLGDLFEITSSKRVFKSEWRNSGIPFYRAREIVSLAKNKPFRSPIFISEEMYNAYKLKYGAPKEGDILATGVGTLGICYLVKNEDKFYFKDGNIIWFKNISSVNSRFIEYFFKSSSLKDQIENHAGGATVKTFTIKTAKEINILLPSLSEQKKIVARLDALSEKIKKLQEYQKSTQSDLVALEQSILSKAFSG